MKKEKIIATCISITILIGFLLATIFADNILYWTYYKPFYKLFKNVLYLPLYLHIAIRMPFIILLFIIGIKIKKIIPKIISLLLSLLLLFLHSYNIINDIIFINTQEKYLTAECDIDTLEKRKDKRRFSYTLNDYSNGPYNSAREMDIYQYKELLKIKEKDNDAKIFIYYLPNTNKTIKYEIIKL